MKRSKKTVSIVLMLLMVATTLMPTWAFGTENQIAAQGGAGETPIAEQSNGAGAPTVAKPSVKSYSYTMGETAKALKAEATSPDGGTLTYQWQSSTDGKNFTNIKDADKAEYIPQVTKAGTVYYRVVVTNTNGGAGTAAEGEIITVTVAENAVAVQSTEMESAEPSGSGTTEDPYLIGTADQLMWFADKVNSSAKKSTSALCGKLTADIDLTGKDWTPIGQYTSSSDYVYFGGTFDGDGHTVSGFKIDNAKAYQALFGYVKGGTIRNLTVKGSVKTSTGSTAYAAGIVAYGNPVTISNCTNEVDVTATAKGYVAGISAYLGNGSKLENCSNKGQISGCGNYVGGMAGNVSGATSVVTSCFNDGKVENAGKPSSNAFSTGGIAGGASTGVTIERCGNTGAITSTLKRTGGIIGSAGGTISGCFNTGAITGIYGVGGIAGDSGCADTKITGCYNTGNVKALTPTASFKDKGAKGVGGIIGGVSFNYNKAVVTGCYNMGAVSSESTLTDITIGGIIGCSAGKNSSGIATSNLVTASDCWYLDTVAKQGDGYNEKATGITAKTAKQIADGDIGDGWTMGPDGHPILGWQDPNATYKVSFSVKPEDANLVVKDASGKEATPENDHVYKLKNGAYTYEVSADECETKTGSFTVAYSGQTISVSLDIKKYDYVFTTDPEDAKLTVKSGDEVQKPLADGRTYQLAKKGNPYRYTVEKFGYETKSGTLNVKGSVDSDKKNVSLRKLPVYKVHFTVEKAAGGQDSTPVITVTSKDDKDADLEADEDGDYRLPDGAYSYSVSCSGYKTVKGDFTVSGKELTVDGIQLEIQTSWDGESYTEPAKNSQGVYLISSPDELMWFDKNAKLTDSAKLTSDITINEDVSGSDAISQKYKWTPIGTSSSKAYTGCFDGNGHKVSGLYINSTTANTGMFGFVGATGEIKNITIENSVIISSKNYTGAFAGDSKGNISNCHTTATTTVTGTDYVGGIVGELDANMNLGNCSNAAAVHGTGTYGYVGGIAGRVYSNSSNALINSYNTGVVTGTKNVGGVTGSLYNKGTIQNVYNTGTVTAISGDAGGILGNFRDGRIQCAYNAGTIKANHAGGVTGRLEASGSGGSKAVKQVYFAEECEAVGNLNGCTIQNGEAAALSSDALKALTSEELGEGFAADTNGINSGYPVLAWQNGSIKSDDPEKDDNGWQGETAKDAPQQVNGVYQIGTPAELAWFAEKAKESDFSGIKGVLTDDLDLNNNNWNGIGGRDADSGFAGSLDGAGHTIKNLYLKNGKGLVPYNKGTVKNLTVTGMLKGGDETAAVAGTNAGTLENITSEVTVTAGNKAAGIAGNNTKDGTIKECSNKGSITGDSKVAGIVAYNVGSVSGCSNTAMITAGGTFAGGIAAENTTAAKSSVNGSITESANSGHVLVNSGAYAGGIIGWNNADAGKLYNTGNVISRGGYVGGCLGCNTTGSSAKHLYNLGDVAGSYTKDGQDEILNVGGVIGGGTAGSDCWYLSSLAVAGADSSIGAEKADAGTIKNKAGNLASLAAQKDALTGTVSLPEEVQAGETVKASYSDGNGQNPIFIWYRDWSGEQQVLGLGESFTIPNDMVGVKIYAKCMDADHYGIKTAESGKIQGMSGSVRIQGQEVTGHTLTAVYKGSEKNPKYQWYRGSRAIDGATEASYKITSEDLDKVLSVRVSGSLAGYVEAKTGTIQDGAAAGIWPEDQCSEPAVKSGVYQISSEKELKWFVNAVNGGNTSANGALTADLSLTSEGDDGNWYPIGNDKSPYTGNFNGQNHSVKGIVIRNQKMEQGFFGNIGGKGTVKNLKVSGEIKVSGDSLSTGGIAGYLEGKIIYCEYSGSVSGVSYVGGITGQTGLNAKVTECHNMATVSGNENVGGITGAVSYGTISKCINTGLVGTADKTTGSGGIAGLMTNYAVIEGCYNTGAVTGNKNLGGLTGEATVCAVPQGCYNIGTVAKGINAGGSVGSYTGSSYISQTTGSFYLAESQTEATDKTSTGASSETMKKTGFVTRLNQQIGAEYFAADEKQLNDGYPVLKWQTEGSSEGGSTVVPDDPDKNEINVSFALIGDTVHGKDGEHTGDVTWIASKSYTVKKGATAQDLFEKALGDAGLEYEMSGNSYVSSITNAQKKITLSELTNGPYSGWMYTINGKFADYMSAVTLKDGDVMQFFYVDDYTKIDWEGNKTPQEAADEVAAMIEALPDVEQLTLDDAAAVGKAESAYNALSDEAKALISKNLKAKLDAAVAKIAQLQKTNLKEFEKIYQDTGSSLAALAEKTGLTAGASGGEWVALGLARSGTISDKTAEQYSQAAYQYVKKKASALLDDSRSTENSRMILALTSIGKDPTDVAGYNLLEPLADLDYVKSQGINGPIFALLALDSHEYDIPKAGAGKPQTTRDALIDEIFAAQLNNGCWGLDGKTADVDMTAMAIQALAPYYNKNTKVKSSVDDALNRLSQMQESNGGYTSWGTANSESVAQVITALTSLGIDPASDGRFIKNGYSTLDALASFYNNNGGFKHSHSDTTSFNGLATEQAYYALASWYRLKEGKTSLYDMSDVTSLTKIIEKKTEGGKDSNKGANKETLNPSGTTLAPSGTTRSITKKATIKLGKMTSAAKNVVSKLDAVVKAGLPKNAKEYTDDQIKQITEAYKAYNALSVSEKKAVEATDTWDAFSEITQNLASMYHYDEATGIDVRSTKEENLPWYIKLVVTPKKLGEKQRSAVTDVLGEESEVFALYDIHFINTLDNSEWHPTGLIRVKMPMISIGNYKTPVIVHIADNGKIRIIEGHVDSAAGTIEFEASDFSLYGIAGSDQSIDSLLGAQAAADIMPWILAGAAAAAVLIILLIVRNRRNKREFYE